MHLALARRAFIPGRLGDHGLHGASRRREPYIATGSLSFSFVLNADTDLWTPGAAIKPPSQPS